MRIPLSTYRLQFGRDFGFRDAAALTPYLHGLGITDVYASPVFRAHSYSASGYDIVDPTSLNPALGSHDDFVAFCEELKRYDMGLVLDIVPNHMSANSSNSWWKDVLENGPSSPWATYFDIEWDPPSHSRSGKMLWPILGAPYADVLERRELTLTFSEDGFGVRYFDRTLPLDPSTYGVILNCLQRAPTAAASRPRHRSGSSCWRSFSPCLPAATTEPEAVILRRQLTAELKRRLWTLYSTNG